METRNTNSSVNTTKTGCKKGSCKVKKQGGSHVLVLYTLGLGLCGYLCTWVGYVISERVPASPKACAKIEDF